ncbi:MAG: hypothetical protein KBT00_01935 [Bacteroidales bacterium]|nr:hypothetical protein [Candidatus Cacconaster merdequi]
MLKKISDWYKKQSDSTKALIWIGVVAVIGIILRWDYIMEQAAKGFRFYSSK